MAHLGRAPLHYRYEIHELAAQPGWRGCHRSGHALKPPGLLRRRSLAGVAVSPPAFCFTGPLLAAPLIFTAARSQPAPRGDALPAAACYPRVSDSLSREIRRALCRRPCQCRLCLPSTTFRCNYDCATPFRSTGDPRPSRCLSSRVPILESRTEWPPPQVWKRLAHRYNIYARSLPLRTSHDRETISPTRSAGENQMRSRVRLAVT